MSKLTTTAPNLENQSLIYLAESKATFKSLLNILHTSAQLLCSNGTAQYDYGDMENDLAKQNFSNSN